MMCLVCWSFEWKNVKHVAYAMTSLCSRSSDTVVLRVKFQTIGQRQLMLSSNQISRICVKDEFQTAILYYTATLDFFMNREGAKCGELCG